MSDFIVTGEAVFPPHHCHVCHAHRGTFLDLRVDGIDGRFYLCLDCVRSAARTCGFLLPEQQQEWRENLADAHQRIQELEAALEDARNHRLVPLPELEEFMRRSVAAAQNRKPKPAATA